MNIKKRYTKKECNDVKWAAGVVIFSFRFSQSVALLFVGFV